MRVITSNEHTTLVCRDKPGAGGACHEYEVQKSDDVDKVFATVSFQNGAIKESGVNGCTNEELLTIVVDRLQGFQSGQFNCRENAVALTHIETGLLWLKKRTLDRMARGVEGTLVV